MSQRALALVVVLRQGDITLGTHRFYAGAGQHLHVGRHVRHDGFSLPMDHLGISEVQLFLHGSYTQRAPDASPWTLIRLEGVEVTFAGPARERKWHPVTGIPSGEWCSLHAEDQGILTIGEYTIEFRHEGPAGELSAEAPSAAA